MKNPNFNSGWMPMTREEEITIWDRFYPAFSFHTSVYREKWPVFAEPEPSITFYIGHQIFREPKDIYNQLIHDLERNMLEALRSCVFRGSKICALNWNHQCYWLDPYHKMVASEVWKVPALPNGDYYLFLAEDFSFGILGQPWEMTMCVFGQRLLDAFEGDWPQLFNRIARKNGRDIDPVKPITWKVIRDRVPDDIYLFQKTFLDGTRVDVSVAKDNDKFIMNAYVIDNSMEMPHKVNHKSTDDLYFASSLADEECRRWDYELR